MKDDVFPPAAGDVLDDIEALARPPAAPLAMPKQVLEAPVLAPVLAWLRQLAAGRRAPAGRRAAP